MLEEVVAYHVGRFALSTGIDPEDLAQEARIAAARAVATYDPAHASLRTYASRCVYRRLLTVATRERRRYPAVDDEPLDEEEPSADASPEDAAVFREMLRELPEDAALVCDLILGDASRFAGLSPSAARRAVRDALDWPRARLARAFESVSASLASGGRGMIRASR